MNAAANAYAKLVLLDCKTLRKFQIFYYGICIYIYVYTCVYMYVCIYIYMCICLWYGILCRSMRLSGICVLMFYNKEFSATRADPG